MTCPHSPFEAFPTHNLCFIQAKRVFQTHNMFLHLPDFAHTVSFLFLRYDVQTKGEVLSASALHLPI